VRYLAGFDGGFLCEKVWLLHRSLSRGLRRGINRSLQKPLALRQLLSHAPAQLRIIDCGGRFHISAVKICKAQVAIEAQALGERFVRGGIEGAR
jgi:hypothetical protein